MAIQGPLHLMSLSGTRSLSQHMLYDSRIHTNEFLSWIFFFFDFHIVSFFSLSFFRSRPTRVFFFCAYTEVFPDFFFVITLSIRAPYSLTLSLSSNDLFGVFEMSRILHNRFVSTIATRFVYLFYYFIYFFSREYAARVSSREKCQDR